MRTVPVVGLARPMVWSPAPRAIRVPAWAPARPQLGQRPQLGAGWLDELASSIGIAAVGGVVAYAAGVLPEGAPRIVVRSVGFLAIGYAVLKLFLGETAAAAAEERPAAIPKKEAFDAIIGQFIQPRTYEAVNFGGLSATSYTAKLLVTNPSLDAVTFRVRLWAEETPISSPPLFGMQVWAANSGTVAETSVTLQPKEQKTIPFDLSTVTSGFKVALLASLQIKLTAQKIGMAGQVSDLAKVEFFGS